MKSMSYKERDCFALLAMTSFMTFYEPIKIDDLVKSLFERHPGESRGPDVVPTKVGNHIKDWIPVFTGNPGFRRLPRTRSGVRRNDEFYGIATFYETIKFDDFVKSKKYSLSLEERGWGEGDKPNNSNVLFSPSPSSPPTRGGEFLLFLPFRRKPESNLFK